MGRLISIHDIDEFSATKRIPDAAVSSQIISNVRKLHEIDELERFLRVIICDPNDTPLGPTEIADMLTTHIHINTEQKVAGCVLKGRSFAKVSSKHVTHQFAKLRTIPDLGLMAFVAVGVIQDDAQRDFIQAALDSGCDYLIIDAHDCARLLIGEEKLCPQDGLPFDEAGACPDGHVRDEGIPLVMTVREKRQFTVMNQQDVSHAGAKRYSATVLLDCHYSHEVIKDIVQEVTDHLTNSCYYRNDLVKARWAREPAHAVSLFVAYDPTDIRNANWVCRTSWIDDDRVENMRPMPLDGDEAVYGIAIKWNKDYLAHKDFIESYQGTKEEVLEGIQSLWTEMSRYANQAIAWFREFQAGRLSEQEMVSHIQSIEAAATDAYQMTGNLPIPPEDCAEFEQACQCLFGSIHDMFLYYTDNGLKTWPAENRKYLMASTIKRYEDDLRKVEFEEKKVHQ